MIGRSEGGAVWAVPDDCHTNFLVADAADPDQFRRRVGAVGWSSSDEQKQRRCCAQGKRSAV